MIGICFERVGYYMKTTYCVMDNGHHILEQGQITSRVTDLLDWKATRDGIMNSLHDRFQMQILIEDYGLVEEFKNEVDINRLKA